MRAFEFLREEEVSGEGQGSFKLPGTDKEVTITVPVTVNIPASSGGGDVNIDGGTKVNTTIAAPATDEMPDDPVWVPPQQQTLELQKQQGGKQSTVINQIVKSDNGPDTDPSDGVFADHDDGEDRAPEQSIYAAGALSSGWDEDGDDQRLAGTGDEGNSGDTGPADDENRIIELMRKLIQR